MAMLVVTAAPVPPVVVPASPVHVSVAVPWPRPCLTSITPPSGAAIGAMPSLAEADTVIASEAQQTNQGDTSHPVFLPFA